MTTCSAFVSNTDNIKACKPYGPKMKESLPYPILGLVPASLATGLGSDVQRPLATVIVWGLFSATLMTILLIPVLYRIFEPKLAIPDEDDAS